MLSRSDVAPLLLLAEAEGCVRERAGSCCAAQDAPDGLHHRL
jgi:hypothetical protein